MNAEDLSRKFDKLSDCAVAVLEAWEYRLWPATKSALMVATSLSEEDFDAAITELCILGIVKFDGGVGDSYYKLLEVGVFDLLKTTPKIDHRFTIRNSEDNYTIAVSGYNQMVEALKVYIRPSENRVCLCMGDQSLVLNRREWYRLRNEIENLL